MTQLTKKDFIKITLFINTCKTLTRNERWVLMSLMSYQGCIGIYEDEDRLKPFRIYQTKLKEYFDIDYSEFINLYNTSLFQFIDYEEQHQSPNSSWGMATIDWESLVLFREKYINDSKKFKDNTSITFNNVSPELKKVLEKEVDEYNHNYALWMTKKVIEEDKEWKKLDKEWEELEKEILK